MQTPTAPAALDERIAEAYLYAFAVHDLARTRWNATQHAANPNRVDVNTLSHARRLLGRVLVDGAADLPVGAFWSLSMYRMEPDGRGFFVDNPIDRYTIDDRTPGIGREADGALVLRLQHAMPEDARGRANWLPAPEGRYVLNWRLYEPGEGLLSRRATLPEVLPA